LRDGVREASGINAPDETTTEGQFNERDNMRRIIIILVCAMITPLAFAQTKKTKVQQTTQPAATTETATSSIAGTVRKYEPGKTVLIDSTQGSLSFGLGGSAQIVNNAGNAVTSPLKPGERVRVYFTGTDQNRMVERMVVED
jgi:hypothetical protein